MNLFHFIKQQLPILDLVSEFATLKKTGTYWKGKCPFHQEQTASFTVTPEKEIFYCFGCHQGGDIITFVACMEQCTPIEAAQFLIDRYNLQVPQELTQQTEHSNSSAKQEYFNLCTELAIWCHQKLLASPHALSYLQERNIQISYIKQFQIGYFPGGLSTIKELIAYMQKQNVLVRNLVDTHILFEGKKVLYSPYEERIIFPIADHIGRLCGFGARIFKPGDQRAKYYNSKENEFFNKGSILFGIHHAKQEIQKTGHVYLVEGYTDCIAMTHYGHVNTVATLGTACTKQHLQQLSRYAQVLNLVFDADVAGQKAILRLAEQCWQADLDLYVIMLPSGTDPATLLETDQKLDQCKRLNIFEFYLNSMGESFQHENLNKKIKAIHKFLSIIQNITDPLKKNILLQQASGVFNVPIDSLHEQIRQETRAANPIKPTVSAPNQISPLEKKLFSVIINNVDLLHTEDELYLLEYLASPLKDMLKKLRETHDSNAGAEFSHFFDALTQTEKQLVSQLIIECPGYERSENFDHLLAQFQKKQWKLYVADIKQKLSHVDNEQQIQKIITSFQELKKKLIGRGLI